MNMDVFADIEARRSRVQDDIDAGKTLIERNKLGQFATPSRLAMEIVECVKAMRGQSAGPVHFADPAVGTGAFLSALLHAYPRDQIGSATGIEIDPTFVESAARLWEPVGFQVLHGDFTEPAILHSARGRPNLIITNPPYVRHHHLSRDQKQRLHARVLHTTGLNVSGLAGLYVYFLLLAHDWLDSGGIGAWLIPSEFMSVNYGAAVREYLTSRVTLRAVHRFDPTDVQFGDALVSSAVVVFDKTEPSSAITARFTFGGTMGNPDVVQNVPLEELRRSHKWTTYPRTKSDVDRREMPLGELVLADLFHIQRGIATGANEFFIVPRAQAMARGFPIEHLRPILPSPRAIRGTVIERDVDGYPVLDPQLVLIDCDLPDQEMRVRHPTLWSYLQTAGALGIRRRYLIRGRTPWYKQEQRRPTPFLCTYMGRGAGGNRPLRFIWNRSNAIAANVYLMLYPTGPLASMLEQNRHLEAAVFELLNETTGRALMDAGRVYGGGLHKIEPKELGRIPARRFLDEFPTLASTRAWQTAFTL